MDILLLLWTRIKRCKLIMRFLIKILCLKSPKSIQVKMELLSYLFLKVIALNVKWAMQNILSWKELNLETEKNGVLNMFWYLLLFHLLLFFLREKKLMLLKIMMKGKMDKTEKRKTFYPSFHSLTKTKMEKME